MLKLILWKQQLNNPPLNDQQLDTNSLLKKPLPEEYFFTDQAPGSTTIRQATSWTTLLTTGKRTIIFRRQTMTNADFWLTNDAH